MSQDIADLRLKIRQLTVGDWPVQYRSGTTDKGYLFPIANYRFDPFAMGVNWQSPINNRQCRRQSPIVNRLC